MSIFKCKMCGGTLEIQPGQTVAECEYCGTQQTLPKLDDDRRANLYDRANHFRRSNEFDKAMAIYEKILNEDSTDAESYWSLVLCRYGIEYVEDPITHKRVPTVNRAQFTSIFDDDNYKSALQYADSYQRSLYEAEAKAINEIQKGILAISQQEEPFDVFICYKESDNNGRRTPDSVLANDLYHQLTLEGFKVFFARITLEDKLGTAYEPYIFAALNSAKVMVVLGTKPEYFSAVWVKNEWSRYLSLIKQGQKKMLIPAYKDMDPYDLPEEFSHLQAQDMSKLGFMQDLIRGIKKITQVDVPQATVVRETIVSDGTSNTAPLLKRAFMFLEDCAWASADEYCEKVLDIDPENGEAYLGKALAQEKQRKLTSFIQSRKYNARATPQTLHLQPNQAHIDKMADKYSLADYVYKSTIADLYQFDLSYSSNVAPSKKVYEAEQYYWGNHKWLSKAEKYLTGEAAENYIAQKKELFDALQQRIVEAEKAHTEAVTKLERDYAAHIQQADGKARALYEEGADRKDSYYQNLVELAEKSEKVSEWKDVAKKFQALGDYKDSKELAKHYSERAEEEQARIDAERAQAAENARKEAKRIAKRNGRIAIITISIICAVAALAVLLNTVIIPTYKYNKAVALLEAGQYSDAIAAFEAMDGYKDSEEQIEACKIAILNENYDAAVALMKAGQYSDAITAFEAMDGYKDSAEQIEICKTAILDESYDAAVALMKARQYSDAITAFKAIDGYKDSAAMATESAYQLGLQYWNQKDFENSNKIFRGLGTYKDSAELIHTHSYTSTVTLEPSCEKEGTTLYSCTNCDHTYTEAIPATGHTYEEKVTLAPGCETSGKMTLTCACGHTKTETIPATGHKYDNGKITKAATCTTDGVKKFTCSNCAASYTEKVSATGHKYNGKITKAATCTTDGVKTFTCSNCANSYTEKISATGHSFTDATCEKPKTCTSCGQTSGSALGHDWQAKEKTPICSRCNKDFNTLVTVTHNAPTTVYSFQEHAINIIDVSCQVELYNNGFSRAVVKITATSTESWVRDSRTYISLRIYDGAGNALYTSIYFIIARGDDGTFTGYEYVDDYSVSTDNLQIKIVVGDFEG